MFYAQPLSHISFILKPESDLVKEAMWSLNATNGGIEAFPICGYILHSLFLKLTGAQEQKLKCICWEMACRDYDYRYDRFERNRYSECSNYKDKCMVYNDIIDEIKKHDESFAVDNVLKNQILTNWRTTTQQLFDSSLLVRNFKNSYDEYVAMVAGVNEKWIMNDAQLLSKQSNIPVAETQATCGLALNEIFEKYIYRERNRCAHNTRSYQHNLPSLKSMMADDYKLQNYFLYMSVLLLLDTIYVKLFKKYLQTA